MGKIMGYKDIELDSNMIGDYQTITEFIIPNNIKIIRMYTFDNCEKLKSVTIPNSVLIIKEGAFQQCSSLESINIPSSVTHIEDFCFFKCNNLKKITFNNYNLKIGNYSFLDTPFYNVFDKLTNLNKSPAYKFIEFCNTQDKLEYVSNGILELSDISFLLDEKEYMGFKEGLNYGI